jgi:serine/threonine protein phosphatase PrpC
MGGHNGGRHAAELAVQIIVEEVSKSDEKNPFNALHTAIEKANAAIWNESQEDRSLKGMGTTVVALLLTSEKAISSHVGDSRIYQVRNGEILFRTYDHSHVFEMVKAGLITEEQARLSEKSNIITRALGIKSNVDIEITDNLSYQNGDRFLLCTDGIWGAIPESQLLEFIIQKGGVESVVSNLVTKVDAIGVANGNKHDNLTAALIEIEADSSFQQVENKKVMTTPKLPKSRSNKLIYLLLITLLGVLAVSLYFITQKKTEVKKIKKKVIIRQIQNVDTTVKDTTTN